MLLTLVIPVFNETERIEKTFHGLKKGITFHGINGLEIIFVNDGSTDKTHRIISSWIKTKRAKNITYRLLSYKNNRGKGHAVKRGMLASQGDYTLIMDADMSTPLIELKKLLPFMEKGFDVVVGTRKNGHSTVVKHQPLYREILGKGFTFLSNIILNTWITDFTCGFKLFSKQAVKDIFPRSQVEHWGYDAELLFLARKLGYPIKEVAVVWSNDERTKVNLLQALPQTLMELMTIRLNDIQGKYRISSRSVIAKLRPALRWITANVL
jgi:dolichyl-phosphate beta-glucosyltransferase